MRSQTVDQQRFNTLRTRAPRLIVRIMYSVSSPSITSHTGIAGIPGNTIDGVLKKVSSTSQQVWPEDGRSTIGSLSFDVIDNASPTNLTEELRS